MRKILVLVLSVCAVGFWLYPFGSNRKDAAEEPPPSLTPSRAGEHEERRIPEPLLDAAAVDGSTRTPLDVDASSEDGELAQLRAELEQQKRANLIMARALDRLTRQAQHLEIELAVCGNENGHGLIGQWLGTLNEDERPRPATLRSVAGLLYRFPVEVTREEGLWFAERFELNDWKTYGDTIEEAAIVFLGPDRLARELPEDRLAELREDWSEEGYFR